MSKSSHKEFVKPYRVTKGGGFRLRDFKPDDTGRFGPEDKEEALALLAERTERLTLLQEKLYAHDRWSLLLVFQAMDAAGKDSAIKHVMSGVNPQGCEVHAFKAPSAEEQDHDFLWRTTKALPQRGRIGIFNRSYYEETLVVRVHPELLAAEKVPSELVDTKTIWKERFEDISAFEQYLSRNGVVIRKFFLNVSKEEQKKRFLERLDKPEKNWKFAMGDVAERGLWRKYMEAYEDTIRHTSSKEAPWYVVPADRKWYTRLVVSSVIIDALESMPLAFPKVDAAKRKELNAAREALLGELAD